MFFLVSRWRLVAVWSIGAILNIALEERTDNWYIELAHKAEKFYVKKLVVDFSVGGSVEVAVYLFRKKYSKRSR